METCLFFVTEGNELLYQQYLGIKKSLFDVYVDINTVDHVIICNQWALLTFNHVPTVVIFT